MSVHCMVLALLAVSVRAHAAETPLLAEGFEQGLAAWRVGAAGKQPLVITDTRARTGRFGAYSGPPGQVRVSRHAFALPVVGRVEVWFYDDMAPAKHQLAGVLGADEELLSIACTGGSRYQCRAGRTYHETPVARSEGWHQFAWECDGRQTEAFLDGRPVGRNPRLDRIREVSLGSYWDASAGWYDDLAVISREPEHAAAVGQAEDALAQGGPAGAKVVVGPARGAVGMALAGWERPGHWVEWVVGGLPISDLRLPTGGAMPSSGNRSGSGGRGAVRAATPGGSAGASPSRAAPSVSENGTDAGPQEASRAGEGERGMLLLKYATGAAGVRRLVSVQPAAGGRAQGLRVALPRTGGADAWGFVGVPVRVPAGRARVRVWAEAGAVSLDWLALVPAAVPDAAAYGKALDDALRLAPLLRRAWDRLPRAVASPGILGMLVGDAPLPPTAGEVRAAVEGERAAVAQGCSDALRADLPKLAGIYRLPPEAAWGPETPLSREYYRRLLRYVRLVRPRLRDWPLAAGCRYHKVDNSAEHAVRQNATVVLALSVLATMGDYDARRAGVSRESVRAEAAGLLRYLGMTHAANLLPTGDGRPWGDHWQSAFWSATAGHAAWLAWDLLDDETRLAIARMVEHEADRFLTRPPDSGEWHDTKAEENAWNSEIVALAACMFPGHPRAGAWHERAIVYMANAFSEAADHEDDTLLDGRPVKEWVTTTNVHPDHTLENHNRVHPDYLSTFGLSLRNALLYRRAGRETPRAAFHHAADAYGVVKGLTAANGSLFYVNGQDWWPHRHDVPLMSGGLMGLLTGDPEAAFLERATLDFLGRMHSRFDDGRAWDPREYNYPNAEEELMARYAELYLAHRLVGDGPPPVTREGFLQAHSGVRRYDIGGFVTHRTPRKFASFAWANGAMGLVYVDDDTWLTGPWERGLVGSIRCEGAADTAPRVVKHSLDTSFGGFAFVGQVERCGGKVEQGICMASLPGAPVLYLEVLRAREQVRVLEVATGALGVLNEDAAPIAPNRRTVWQADGRAVIAGAAKAAGRGAPPLLTWETGWANLDGRLGVISTAGRMAYRDTHAYSRSRLQEELYAVYRADVGEVAAGEEIAASVVALHPGQAPEETRAAVLESARFGGTGIAARYAGWIVAMNPGAAPVEGDLFGRHLALGPLAAAVIREPSTVGP